MRPRHCFPAARASLRFGGGEPKGFAAASSSASSSAAGRIPASRRSSGSASSAVINWSNGTSVQIGNIRYSVANNPLALVPVTTNNGVTSVQAIITDTTVPEPSTYMLISGSLVGLGLMRKRLKK